MRSLVVALFLCAQTSMGGAQEHNTFYAWAKDVVTETVFNEEKGTVEIIVKDTWDNADVPSQHRLALVGYIPCTKFVKEIELQSSTAILLATVRSNTHRPLSVDVKMSIPRHEGICTFVLSNVQTQIHE